MYFTVQLHSSLSFSFHPVIHSCFLLEILQRWAVWFIWFFNCMDSFKNNWLKRLEIRKLKWCPIPESPEKDTKYGTGIESNLDHPLNTSPFHLPRFLGKQNSTRSNFPWVKELPLIKITPWQFKTGALFIYSQEPPYIRHAFISTTTGLSKQNKKHGSFWFPSSGAHNETSWKYKQQFSIYRLKKSHILETKPQIIKTLWKEGIKSISALFPHPWLDLKMFTWAPSPASPCQPQPDRSLAHREELFFTHHPQNEAFQVRSVKRNKSLGTHYCLFFQCLLPSSDLKCFFWVF